MEFVLDERTDPAAHPPAGHRDGPVRPGLAVDRRARVVPVARARSCGASSTAPPSTGWVALAGTELEFIAFDTTYEAGPRRRLPRPARRSTSTTSTTRSSAPRRVEPLLRDIRNHMYAAGLDVEGAKGECNFGQHEIGFLYADALTTADNHAVYKTAAKEIAAQQGKAITFMAKYNEREGSSCHIHLSLRGADGELVFWDAGPDGVRRSTTSSSPACWPPLRDFTLLYAPNINSYKRFADGSFAPTTIAWGLDNRTCAVRLVGQGAGARMENRIPGARRQPLPRAGRDARRRAARHRERARRCADELVGNAYTSDRPRVPAHDGAPRARRSPRPRSPGRPWVTRSSTTT